MEGLDPLLETVDPIETTDPTEEATDVFVSADRDLVPYDPLSRYLAEVRKYPYLTLEEEKRLALLKEEGDMDAISTLVLSHLRLVVSIAMEYRSSPFPLMDLIQEGNVGLLQGVKRFDPARAVRLSTYVTWWIRAYILKYLLENWRLVKIGTTEVQRKLFFQLSKERDRLIRLGYEATPKLLANRLNVREQDVIEMDKRLGIAEMSLDAPVGYESEEPLLSTLPSLQQPVDERLEEIEWKEQLRAQLMAFSQTLSSRERGILQARILSESPTTLDALGRKYRISKERVRQIEATLLKKMKVFIQARVKR